MPTSLLTAKQRRMPVEVQRATLARIGKRAAAKADWLQYGSDTYTPDPANMPEVRKLRAKAAAALAEIHTLLGTAEFNRRVAAGGK